MRSVPESLDPAIVAEIDARLANVEREDRVRIVWAIESGSRAWGFPSPDSDYDGRFLYLRPRDAYRSLWPERDVIETPLDKVFDVNGWDIAKAIRLLVKGNATVGEWLRSPIVCSGEERFRDQMLELAEDVADRVLLARHYLHVGRQQWELAAETSLKKVFYAVRPAATLRWLRVHPDATVPPMNLPEILAQSEPDLRLAREVGELIELKSVTRELGRGSIPPAIKQFVLDEFSRAEEIAARADAVDRRGARAVAQECFTRLVDDFAP